MLIAQRPSASLTKGRKVLVVSGSIKNSGVKCSLSNDELAITLPALEGAKKSSSADYLLACHSGLLKYAPEDAAHPRRLACDHVALRVQKGRAFLLFRNVSFCTNCTLTGGGSFVGNDKVFFSTTTRAGTVMKEAKMVAVLLHHQSSPAEKRSADALQPEGSVCRDPERLLDAERVRAQPLVEGGFSLAGSVAGTTNSSATKSLQGMRLRATMRSWARVPAAEVWAQTSVREFKLACYGAAVVDGKSKARLGLPGFCTTDTTATLAVSDDDSTLTLKVVITSALTLCAHCSLVGLGPENALFAASYKGDSRLDEPSIALVRPDCAAKLPPPPPVTPATPAGKHSSMCASDAGKGKGVCAADKVISAFSLLAPTPGAPSFSLTLVAPGDAPPQPAQQLWVSGTVLPQSGALCLKGTRVLFRFDRRVQSASSDKYFVAPTTDFIVACAGMGVAGLAPEQTDISRPCTDLIALKMTVAGVQLTFKDIALSANSWLVGFGPGGAFFSVAHKDGLLVDVAGVAVEAPTCVPA